MAKQLFSIKERVAFITGSSRGIGAAIARAMADAGASTVIHSISGGEKAQQVADDILSSGGKAVVVSGDLGEEGSSERIFQEVIRAFGKLDILVLNASVQIPQNWLTITREDFEKQVAVNYRSSLELLQKFVPKMIERKWGRILSIGSVQEAKPHPDMLVYSSLKNAQTSMVLSLAKQLAPYGITANNLAPGVILTDRNLNRLSNKDYERQVIAQIPAGYIGEPPDCTGAALLLCSEEGRYITGQNLFVDGGMSL